MQWSQESPESKQAWLDKGKRCSDLIRQHLLDDPEQARQCWVAIRLSDGGSDGTLYPAKEIAVVFQIHPRQCAYLKVLPDGIPPREATSYLYHTAQLYQNAELRDRLIYTADELLHRR